MTRYPEPFPGQPQGRYQGMEGRPMPPLAQPYAHGPQGGNTRRKRRSPVIFIALAVALLIGVAAVLAYFAYRNDWFGVGSLSPSASIERAREQATVIFSGQASALSAASGNTVQGNQSSTVAWIRSSLVQAKSSGPTDGVSVTVPTTLSDGLAGKLIRVTVSAARGNTSSLPPFAVTYSTAGAGNSGWSVFQPHKAFEDFSFNYRVPPRAGGLAQYVGIWSDIEGQNAPLAVRSIKITVLR
jgi:hypothetical protein